MNNNQDDYGWRTPIPPQTSDYLEAPILKLLTLIGAKRIIDIGCGNGAFARRLAAAGFSVVAIDRDANGIRIARECAPHIQFFEQSIDHTPDVALLASGPFDAAVSTEVIEHLYAPHQLLKFAAQVLSPGAHLVLSTPYHGFLKNLAISAVDGWDRHHTALWHGGHIKFWSKKTLFELLRTSNYQPWDFRGVGRVPYLWKSMIVSARLMDPETPQHTSPIS